MVEKKLELCPTCGHRILKLEDFTESEKAIFIKYEQWKKLNREI
jgi:hypothetical protein